MPDFYLAMADNYRGKCAGSIRGINFYSPINDILASRPHMEKAFCVQSLSQAEELVDMWDKDYEARGIYGYILDENDPLTWHVYDNQNGRMLTGEDAIQKIIEDEKKDIPFQFYDFSFDKRDLKAYGWADKDFTVGWAVTNDNTLYVGGHDITSDLFKDQDVPQPSVNISQIVVHCDNLEKGDEFTKFNQIQSIEIQAKERADIGDDEFARFEQLKEAKIEAEKVDLGLRSFKECATMEYIAISGDIDSLNSAYNQMSVVTEGSVEVTAISNANVPTHAHAEVNGRDIAHGGMTVSTQIDDSRLTQAKADPEIIERHEPHERHEEHEEREIGGSSHSILSHDEERSL